MLLLNSLISRHVVWFTFDIVLHFNWYRFTWFDLRLILSYTLTDIASRSFIYVWYCTTL